MPVSGFGDLQVAQQLVEPVVAQLRIGDPRELHGAQQRRRRQRGAVPALPVDQCFGARAHRRVQHLAGRMRVRRPEPKRADRVDHSSSGQPLAQLARVWPVNPPQRGIPVRAHSVINDHVGDRFNLWERGFDLMVSTGWQFTPFEEPLVLYASLDL